MRVFVAQAVPMQTVAALLCRSKGAKQILNTEKGFFRARLLIKKKLSRCENHFQPERSNALAVSA